MSFSLQYAKQIRYIPDMIKVYLTYAILIYSCLQMVPIINPSMLTISYFPQAIKFHEKRMSLIPSYCHSSSYRIPRWSSYIWPLCAVWACTAPPLAPGYRILCSLSCSGPEEIEKRKIVEIFEIFNCSRTIRWLYFFNNLFVRLIKGLNVLLYLHSCQV